MPDLIDISHRILSLAPLLPTCTYSAGPLWYRMCRDTKLLLKSQGKVRTVSFKDVRAETVAVTVTSYKVPPQRPFPSASSRLTASAVYSATH